MLLKILFITACCQLVGAAGFGAMMDWPNTEAMLGSVLFSPLLALGGWFTAFLILPLVGAMWSIRAAEILRPGWLFILIGAVVGTAVGAVLPGGPESRWRVAFMVGGCLAGTLSNVMIVLSISAAPNHGAPPNGGPASSLANSGSTVGPPSVS